MTSKSVWKIKIIGRLKLTVFGIHEMALGTLRFSIISRFILILYVDKTRDKTREHDYLLLISIVRFSIISRFILILYVDKRT